MHTGINLGGLALSPLGADGWDKLRAWAHERAMRDAKRAMDAYAAAGVELDPSERRALVKAALERGDDSSLIESLPGVAHALWLHLLPAQPHLTEEAAARLVTIANYKAVWALLERVNYSEDEPAKPSAPVEGSGRMTAEQMREQAAPVSIEQARQEHFDRRNAIFDALCQKHGLTPEQLNAMTDDAAKKLWCDVSGMPPEKVDRMQLRAGIWEYVTHKGQAKAA